jgi:hypothetical protein
MLVTLAEVGNVLQLTFAIRTREPVTVQFPRPEVGVKISGMADRSLNMDLSAQEVALSAEKKYPPTNFKTELVDAKTNKWKITRKKSFITVVDPKVQILELPMTKSQKLTTESTQVAWDEERDEEVLITSSQNIWPEKEPLRDATIALRIPEIVLNGVTYPARDFVFKTNYKEAKHRASLSSSCPTVSEIFHLKGKTWF